MSKRENDALSRLRARLAQYSKTCDDMAELEAARLASLKDAERRRDEALSEGREEDYRFFDGRVHHFEKQRFEVGLPDFTDECIAVADTWGDGPATAGQALADSVEARITQQAELLRELHGFPLPDGVQWFCDDLIVRALIADGLLQPADWLWYHSVCREHSYIDRGVCPAKLAELWNVAPTVAAVFPRLGSFGRLAR